MTKTSSPSNTYVAICIQHDTKSNTYCGHKLKKFTVPSDIMQERQQIAKENNYQITPSDIAFWYFLNRLNAFDYIEGVIAFEDYQNLTECK